MVVNQTVAAELANLFNLEKVSGNERNKILAICNDVIDNATFFNEVHNSMITVAENKNFKIETHLPALISGILRVIQSVEYYKQVNEERMPFVIYCVLVSALYEFYPDSLKTIEIQLLRTLFKDTIDLVLLLPSSVKIAKSSCLSCLAKTIKPLQRFNKDKIIVS